MTIESDARILSALRSLATGRDTDAFFEAMEALRETLNFSGHRLRIATPRDRGYCVFWEYSLGSFASFARGARPKMAAGGASSFAPFLIEEPETQFWRRPSENAPSEAMSNDLMTSFEKLGVKAGATYPLSLLNGNQIAFTCVAAAIGETPAAFEARFPRLVPDLKLATLVAADFALRHFTRVSREVLTPNQAIVLDFLSEGQRLRDIAARLGKSERTVRHQLASARERLGAATTTEAIAKWFKINRK